MVYVPEGGWRYGVWGGATLGIRADMILCPEGTRFLTPFLL